MRQSGGAVVAVDEAEIVEALVRSRAARLYVEPTCRGDGRRTRADLLASGAIRPDETTVLVLTGSGLKASATIGESS